MDLDKLKNKLAEISEVNPALTCYHRKDPAPVLPLREEPDLLSWLENTWRLVTENEGDSQEISTIEEEELSALMGEKKTIKLKKMLQKMTGKIKTFDFNSLAILITFALTINSFVYKIFFLGFFLFFSFISSLATKYGLKVIAKLKFFQNIRDVGP